MTTNIKNLRIVLGDQLNLNISSLADINKKTDAVLMMEVREEATYVKHHPQKIAFIFSAMRHFAEELRQQKIHVHYIDYESADNRGSFTDTLAHFIELHRPEKMMITEPGEYRVLSMINCWQKQFKLPVEIRPDDRFFCSSEDFKSWAKNRKQLRMEMFYRQMRVKTGILMDANEQPVGGRWNFDAENRQALPKQLKSPAILHFKPDKITQAVLDLVKKHFSQHFGKLDNFGYAVTRKDALVALKNFIDERLPLFGDYQDAMQTDNYYLFHSVLSPYLNAGLLLPREVCLAAEKAYFNKKAPINAVEGFIRQILGWREYVRGVYWTYMPEYAKRNALNAKRKLPAFYWTGDTKMNCLHQVIKQTEAVAHSHHIQRLMITGNFALLYGVKPEEICEWYLAVYIDAYDWVELPNTLGMVMHADGAVMGSKPYAASGAYINRMSDFCKSCHYNVKEKTGETACPFNYLYWNFLIENQEKLKSNPRMKLIYQAFLKKMPYEQQKLIMDSAKKIIGELK